MTSVVDMEMRLMTCRFIPVHRLEEHAALFHATRIGVKPLSDWATVGVIDRCLTKDKFTVAKVTNLRGHYFHVFIFGLPHRQYRLKVGSVIAIYRPIVLQPTELNSSVALYVNDKKQIWVVGESKDLAKCQAFVSSDKQCDVMIDSRAGEFCDSHIKRAFGLSRNTRMELASGDTGLDVRWTQQRQTKQGTLYQATSNRKSWKEDSYVIQGKGVFKSDGTQKKVHNTPTKDLLPKHDKALW
ncbi:hypothetical protein BDF14DRAFT_1771513 [Spinellus fusiger]|nr:hypothetical protein BDF14DRAFT_1771513 [Spinellus fusiger]